MIKIIPLDEEYRYKTFKFVELYEYCCTELMEHLLLREKGAYILLDDTTVCGVLFVNNVVLLHCLPFAEASTEQRKKLCREFTAAVPEIFKVNKISCIIGEKKGTELLLTLFPDTVFCKHRVNYILMTNRKSNDNRHIRKNEKKYTVYPKYELVFCKQNDLEDLLPLQREYEDVEIFSEIESPHESFLTRDNLKRILEKQIVFALKDKELMQFVSKASTNAIGKNWAQIGGVFTKPEYRRLGLAGCAISILTQKIHDCGKNCVLFVKEKNPAAFNLYRKTGYKEAGLFTIVYLK